MDTIGLVEISFRRSGRGGAWRASPWPRRSAPRGCRRSPPSSASPSWSTSPPATASSSSTGVDGIAGERDLRRAVFRALTGEAPEPGRGRAHAARLVSVKAPSSTSSWSPCGLESAQLGEREIQGQLREALAHARQAGTSGLLVEPADRGGAARRPPGPSRDAPRRGPHLARRDRRRPSARARAPHAVAGGADRRLADDRARRRDAAPRRRGSDRGQSFPRARARAGEEAGRSARARARRVPRPAAGDRGSAHRDRRARGRARPRGARAAGGALAERRAAVDRRPRGAAGRRAGGGARRPACRGSAWTKSTASPTRSATAPRPRWRWRASASTRRSASCAGGSPSGCWRRSWRSLDSATAAPPARGVERLLAKEKLDTRQRHQGDASSAGPRPWRGASRTCRRSACAAWRASRDCAPCAASSPPATRSSSRQLGEHDELDWPAGEAGEKG